MANPDKLEDLASRAEQLKEDLLEEIENHDSKEGAEGTIDARMREAAHRISEGEKKLENAHDMTV